MRQVDAILSQIILLKPLLESADVADAQLAADKAEGVLIALQFSDEAISINAFINLNGTQNSIFHEIINALRVATFFSRANATLAIINLLNYVLQKCCDENRGRELLNLLQENLNNEDAHPIRSIEKSLLLLEQSQNEIVIETMRKLDATEEYEAEIELAVCEIRKIDGIIESVNKIIGKLNYLSAQSILLVLGDLASGKSKAYDYFFSQINKKNKLMGKDFLFVLSSVIVEYAAIDDFFNVVNAIDEKKYNEDGVLLLILFQSLILANNASEIVSLLPAKKCIRDFLCDKLIAVAKSQADPLGFLQLHSKPDTLLGIVFDTSFGITASNARKKIDAAIKELCVHPMPIVVDPIPEKIKNKKSLFEQVEARRKKKRELKEIDHTDYLEMQDSVPKTEERAVSPLVAQSFIPSASSTKAKPRSANNDHELSDREMDGFSPD